MTRLPGIVLAAALGLAPGSIAAQRAASDSTATFARIPRSIRVAAGPVSADGSARRAALPALAAATSGAQPARGRSRRSPLVAGALGFIVPGGGHFYAGEPRRGSVVLGVTMVGAFFALSDGTPRAAATAGSVAFLGGWAFSVIDGSLAARRYNRRQ